MQKLLNGIQHFQDHVFPANRELFERLATGQQPEVLVIGCSDSRLALDFITQSSPGDMFVCRNAGNIVPPRHQAEATSAAIEFAVSALKIRHIVICGHTDCGAMKGLLHPEKLEHMPHVSRWLRHAEGARRALDELHADCSEHEALVALTKLNVVLQLQHLESHPHVFAQMRAGALQLHGWVFQIENGAFEKWNRNDNQWTRLGNDRASHPSGLPGSALAHEVLSAPQLATV